MNQLLTFQTTIRQELPKVKGSLDYHIFREQLERISEIIELGGLDFEIAKHLIKEAEKALKKEAKKTGIPKKMSIKDIKECQKIARTALRYGISRGLIKESYRVFAAHLADSALLQRFCLLDNLGGEIKVPCKSTLQRYEKMVPESILRKVIKKLTDKASHPETEGTKGTEQVLALERAVKLDDYYADLTVVKTNIHFPVDWILLLDGVRSLIKATLCIRKAGIKNRMQDPKEFLKIMNRYAMEMTHTRRKKGCKKERKRLLRLMKKTVAVVRNHAETHRYMLNKCWKDTKLKPYEVNQIIKRIDHILELLPQAVKQAHERIIGERPVKNKDKLLSLYETDTKLIIRGKAGANIEYGNKLFIAEQQDGLILDWKLYRDAAPSDSVALIESLDRFKTTFDGLQPKQVTGDRGLFSKKNTQILADRHIQNNLCPRNGSQLQKQLQIKDFASHQLRRGQTEGRIGILKNCFLGSPFRNKGFESREQGIAWKVLSHNLWVISRLSKLQQKKETLPLAA